MVIASIAAWFTPTILFCVSNLIIATLFIASNSNSKTTENNDHDHDYNQNHQTYSFTRKVPRVYSLLERVKSVKLSSYIPTIVTTTIEEKPEFISIPETPKYNSSSRLAQSIKLSSYIPTIVTTTIEEKPELISTPETPKYNSSSRLAQSIFYSCSYDSQPDSERFPSNKTKPNTLPSSLGRLKSIDISSVNGLKNTISKESEPVSNPPSQLVRVPSFFDRRKSLKIKKVEIKKARSEVRVVSDDEDDVNLRRPETMRAKRNADDDAKAEKFISKFRDQLKLQRLESLDRYNDMLWSHN